MFPNILGIKSSGAGSPLRGSHNASKLEAAIKVFLCLPQTPNIGKLIGPL